MKKLLALLLVLVLCLSMLTGCAKLPSIPFFPSDPSPAQTPAAPETTEEPAAPETTEEPAAPEATEEPAAPETTEEPAAPEATEEPAAPETTEEPEHASILERDGMWELVPFDEMPYERPTLDDLDAAIEAVGQALDAGADYETVEPLLEACDEAFSVFDTLYAIAFIRSCQDKTDDFYAEEYAYLDEISADVNRKIEKLYFRCGMSDLAQELEEKYFWPGFAEEYADEDNAFYDDEMVALLQEESGLVAEYRDLVANPIVILSDGREVEYNTALEEAEGFSYLTLLFTYYEQYNPKLGAVYVELVKNRQLQAKAAGYDSYEELAYDHTFERDYSPALAEEYLQDIQTYIVPLYREVMDSGDFWSLEEGVVDAQRLEELLRFGIGDMGEDVQNTYEFMVKYDLCDLEYSPRKSEMSFQTYLNAYDVPFLFMDAGGNLRDITTFSHEFGHYLDGFINFGAEETVDRAECFSQAMELLMLTRLDGKLSDEELDTLYKMKMLDILSMYVQQAAFAEFEHIIYSTDPEDLSVEYVNQVFLEMCQKYGFCEKGLEGLYGKLWQDIVHFYEQPFYVITYPVSHDIAMQVFQLEEAQPGVGLDKFLQMLPQDYPDMLDTALNAGLDSPFDPGRLEKVADTMRGILLEDQANAA